MRLQLPYQLPSPMTHEIMIQLVNVVTSNLKRINKYSKHHFVTFVQISLDIYDICIRCQSTLMLPRFECSEMPQND